MVSSSFVGYAALTEEIVPVKYGTSAIDIESGEIVPVVRKERDRTISGNSSTPELSAALQGVPALPELLEQVAPQ